jgi:hypothetical protein
MDSLDDITRRLTRLEDRLLSDKPQKPGKLQMVKELLLPAAIALLSFSVGLGANAVAEAQLKQAKQQADAELALQTAEAAAERQLKYLDLFYQDISNPAQPQRQYAALSLLNLIEPAVGKTLATAVALNPENSEAVRAEARTLASTISRFGPLMTYRVIVYQPAEDLDAERVATAIQVGFVSAGFGAISKSNKLPDFFESVGPPRAIEIRYDEPFETEAASKLAEVLGELIPSCPVQLVRTNRRMSPDSIGILIPGSEQLKDQALRECLMAVIRQLSLPTQAR